jgi:hypothetical protein
MGKRDYAWREPKKPKKAKKELIKPLTMQSSPEVQVIPKGKKAKPSEES